MSLNAKKLAFLGLLLAFDVILLILSGIIEFNTLFLLAAASFCVGIAIREAGKNMGLGFYLGSILLGLILAPNKLYCITYAGMGLYVVLIEYFYDRLSKFQGNRLRLYWVIKFVVFNVMYLPMLLLMPKLIYTGKINSIIIVVLFVAGQLVLFLYDRAYDYFQRHIWGKLRIHLKL